MPRSEREIAEYMAYYNNTTDCKAALEALARVEKKSEAEIRAICEKFKTGKSDEMGKQKFSDEIKAEIWEKSLDGVPTDTIADEYHITPAQVHGILSAVRTKQDKERAMKCAKR